MDRAFAGVTRVAESRSRSGAATEGATRRRRRTDPATARRLAVAAFLLALLVGWHIYSLFMPPVLIPGPLRVAQRFAEMWTDWGYVSAAVDSFLHVIESVVMAFTLGVA